MERGVVKRYVLAEVFDEPLAHRFQFAIVVVESWNQQRRNPEPDAGFMVHVLKCLESGR
jgi:hypothetical protein